jgi:hypothetical protein
MPKGKKSWNTHAAALDYKAKMPNWEDRPSKKREMWLG